MKNGKALVIAIQIRSAIMGLANMSAGNMKKAVKVSG